jgi:hypothetical protein
MPSKNSYNGYTPRQREKKFRKLKELIALGAIPPASGQCDLCSDPSSPVEYHDDDYGEPYVWTKPALYRLCRHCHRVKLHQRFARPLVWATFVAHVRRGGYASDLKNPEIKRELEKYHQMNGSGNQCSLVQLREYPHLGESEWFVNLPDVQKS